MTSGVIQKPDVRDADVAEVATRGPKPLTEGQQPVGILIGLWAFVVVPFVALIAAVPLAWGGGLTWIDVAHRRGLLPDLRPRHHGRLPPLLHPRLVQGEAWLRVALAVAGCMAIQGAPTQWVADHRRHHAFSDKEGDPHSPWRFGATFWGLTKGLWFAHMGWLFDRETVQPRRGSPRTCWPTRTSGGSTSCSR